VGFGGVQVEERGFGLPDEGEKQVRVTETQLAVMRKFMELQNLLLMPPTGREMASEMGWAGVSTWSYFLKALVRKGLMSVRPGLSRGAFITEAGVKELEK